MQIINFFYFRVLHKLFLVYLRLSTYKESQSDYFSPEYYANLIYDKYIIDIPKLLDICSLFPDCNKEITKKMVANVFKVRGHGKKLFIPSS